MGIVKNSTPLNGSPLWWIPVDSQCGHWGRNQNRNISIWLAFFWRLLKIPKNALRPLKFLKIPIIERNLLQSPELPLDPWNFSILLETDSDILIETAWICLKRTGSAWNLLFWIHLKPWEITPSFIVLFLVSCIFGSKPFRNDGFTNILYRI